MSRKTPSTSVIDGLPANQREVIDRWLFEENVSFKDAATRLYQDFGVRSSESALGRYWQRRQQQRMLDRIATTAATVNRVEEEFGRNPANTFSAVMGLIQQLALREAIKGEKEVKFDVLSDLASLALSHQGGLLKAQAEARKERELALKKEKLELELRKYQDVVAKASGTLGDSKLSDAEKQVRLRQIFGLS